jgi:hypothetical protein
MGKTYDVKTTYSSVMPMCVTRTYENKPIDFFIGTRIDKDLGWIEIHGVISSSVAMSAKYFVKKNGSRFSFMNHFIVLVWIFLNIMTRLRAAKSSKYSM